MAHGKRNTGIGYTFKKKPFSNDRAKLRTELCGSVRFGTKRRRNLQKKIVSILAFKDPRGWGWVTFVPEKTSQSLQKFFQPVTIPRGDPAAPKKNYFHRNQSQKVFLAPLAPVKFFLRRLRRRPPPWGAPWAQNQSVTPKKKSPTPGGYSGPLKIQYAQDT